MASDIEIAQAATPKPITEIAQALNIQVEFETVPSLKGGATTIFDKAYDLRIFCEKRNLKHLIPIIFG